MSLYHRFKDRFGTAGVVLGVIAIVLAVGGSAIAASGLNGKQKKEVKSIAKSFQGTGPEGKAGAAGTNGTNGKDGAAGTAGTNGTNGKDGTNGKTVLSGTATPTGAVGTDGDFYIETDVSKLYGPKAAGSWPAGVELKGKEGSPWTEFGVLPTGQTETGMYAQRNEQPQPPEGFPVGINTAISIPIPVEPAPTVVYVDIGEDKSGEGCPGLSEAGTPEADAGTLCIYAQGGVFAAYEGHASDGPVGTILYFSCSNEEIPCAVRGAWAVTAD